MTAIRSVELIPWKFTLLKSAFSCVKKTSEHIDSVFAGKNWATRTKTENGFSSHVQNIRTCYTSLLSSAHAKMLFVNYLLMWTFEIADVKCGKAGAKSERNHYSLE